VQGPPNKNAIPENGGNSLLQILFPLKTFPHAMDEMRMHLAWLQGPSSTFRSQHGWCFLRETSPATNQPCPLYD
jgi:hypothetical protein